jgi:hypothetical protein
MEFVAFLLYGLFVAAPVVIGAYAVFFSRRVALQMYKYRKAVWKIGFTESDVRVGQVFAFVVGGVVMIVGLIVAAQFVLQ